MKRPSQFSKDEYERSRKPEERTSVFDSMTGGAREVGAAEAADVRESNMKLTLQKEQNKPLAAENKRLKSQQVWDNLHTVIGGMEADRSKMNARLLAENPLRDRGPEMLVGLQPEDRAGFLQSAGLTGGGGQKGGIDPLHEAKISEAVEGIVKSRMESNTGLPEGIEERDGQTFIAGTNQAVNVADIYRNQARQEIGAQYQSAMGQVNNPKGSAVNVLKGVGALNGLGISPGSLLQQAAMNLAPTKNDMSGMQVSQGGQPMGNYDQWSANKKPYQYTGGPGRGLSFIDTGGVAKPAAAEAEQKPAEQPTAAPVDTVAGLKEPEQKSVGQSLKEGALSYLKKSSDRALAATSPTVFAAEKIRKGKPVEAIKQLAEKVKEGLSMPANTPERQQYFKALEQNLEPALESKTKTNDPFINELRDMYTQDIQTGQATKQQALTMAMQRLMEKYKKGKLSIKKIQR